MIDSVRALKAEISRLENDMCDLVRYALPNNDHDAAKAQRYYDARTRRMYALDEMRALCPRDANEQPRTESKPFVNAYGEATTRDVVCTTYTSAQRRQERAVMRNLGY